MRIVDLHSRISLLMQLFSNKMLFGFVSGHDYLSKTQLSVLNDLVQVTSDKVVEEFESSFTKLVGDGDAVSFASARMGFYALLRFLDIGKGDEVILNGATCSVMVNAVLRSGARPVFSDIDPDTFGSSAEAIAKCVTSNTKIIVAQHSFGIPCAILPIKEIAEANNIFLLEDCALALDSKRYGSKVGTFGDAALFSTDHSKPINTVTGGLIYSRNRELIAQISSLRDSSQELSIPKRKSLWKRFLRERKYANPVSYRKLKLFELIELIKLKLFGGETSYLDQDSGTGTLSDYPYPAKMPAFAAQLGLFELEQWQKNKANRKMLLNKYYKAISQSECSEHLPQAYADNDVDIVPLRFVWSQPSGKALRELMKPYLDVSGTWFQTPIVSTNEPLDSLGYVFGQCPVSEGLGMGMVNLPTSITDQQADILLNMCYSPNNIFGMERN